MKPGLFCMLVLALALAVQAVASASTPAVTISNLSPKLDKNGSIVNAHDGTYRRFGNFWYYHAAQYGECHEPAKNGCDQTADHCGFHTNHNVSIWRSTDLTSGSWEFRGHAVQCELLPDCKILYRPHLVLNPNTGLYTLFVNYVRQSGGYGGYAVYTATAPDGPFTLRNPVMNVTRLCPGPSASAPCGEAQGGAGDFDVFVDETDGAGYIVYGANFYNSIEKLTPDFLFSTGQNASARGKFEGTVFPDYFAEAAVLFKRDEYYYMLYGHCCCFCYQGSGIMVYRARHPMGPWLPQTATHTAQVALTAQAVRAAPGAHDLACRPASDALHVTGYALLGHGSCRDNRGIEPSFYSNNGMISADECSAQCDAMPQGQCLAVGYCDQECAGSCHLYVRDQLPPPDGSGNWHLQTGAGNAMNITRVTNESNWRCFTRSDQPQSRTAQPRRLGDDTTNQGCKYNGAELISATRAQQNFVIEVPTVGGGSTFVWTGDRWQQAPDGIKGNEGQFWAPLHFSSDGWILPVNWTDSFTLHPEYEMN